MSILVGGNVGLSCSWPSGPGYATVALAGRGITIRYPRDPPRAIILFSPSPLFSAQWVAAETYGFADAKLTKKGKSRAKGQLVSACRRMPYSRSVAAGSLLFRNGLTPSIGFAIGLRLEGCLCRSLRRSGATRRRTERECRVWPQRDWLRGFEDLDRRSVECSSNAGGSMGNGSTPAARK